MIVGDEETPGELPPSESERDVLAERRARREELGGAGEQILVRRAEAAEATAHALEDRLAGSQERLRQLEQECADASGRLAEREQELRGAFERLAGAERELGQVSDRLAHRERELHTVSARLGQREEDLRSLSNRLGQREEDLRTVSERLLGRERELERAELEIKGRLDKLEQRVGGLQRELVRERDARQAAERELGELRAALARTEVLAGELRETARQLRAAVEAVGANGAAQSAAQPSSAASEVAAEPATGEREETTSAAVAEAAPPAAAAPEPDQPPAHAGDQPPATDEQERRAQMADALASAVQRLRARVAAVGELHEHGPQQQGPQQEGPQQPEQQPVEYVPPVAAQTSARTSWLAPAIRSLAVHRDARLAAELVLELLPVRVPSTHGALRYEARIAELGGGYEVAFASGAGVGAVARSTPQAHPDFVLEGPAAAFAEIAGGGFEGGGALLARRPEGMRVRRGRLRARRLLAALSRPVTLGDLADAGVTVWPGLLLLALAEAIEPAWIAAEEDVVLDFAIAGPQSATLRVHVHGGEPVQVARADVDAEVGAGAVAGAQQSAAVRPAAVPAEPAATVKIGERAFLCMLAGRDLPAGERVLVSGDRAAPGRLLALTDRVQGIRRSA